MGEKTEKSKKNSTHANSYNRVFAKYELLKERDGPEEQDEKGEIKIPKNIHWYFNSILDFKEFRKNRHILNIIIFYICMRIELAQRMTLRCDAIKRHNVNVKIADETFYDTELRRKAFFARYKRLTEKSISDETKAIIESTRLLRNSIIHGDDKDVTPMEKETAIYSLLEYADSLNEEVFEISGFKPFGDLTGFAGSRKAPANDADSKTTLRSLRIKLKDEA